MKRIDLEEKAKELAGLYYKNDICEKAELKERIMEIVDLALTIPDSSLQFNDFFEKGDKVNYKTYKNATVIDDYGSNVVTIQTTLSKPIVVNRNQLELATKGV